MKATILPEVEAQDVFHTALGDLTKLVIHCEAKDFSRPPPLLAALYELLTGRPFENVGGAAINFQSAMPGASGSFGRRLPVVWMRIDTRYGDLALSSGRRIELGPRLAALSEGVIDDLTAGHALLVLDWSHEGRPTFWTSNIRKIVGQFGIPPQNIVVLTQNTAAPEPAHNDQPDINIVNAHSFIPAFWRLLFGSTVREGEFHDDIGFAAAAPPERSHHFICMNYEATATRACLVSRLLERPERGFVSFQKDQFRRSMPGSRAFEDELDGVSVAMERGDNHSMVREFLAHYKNYAIDLAPRAAPRGDRDFLPRDAFKKSSLFVVTEKEMARPDQRRFTEKTLKAIIAGLPFVVFGNQGTIALLREAGFDVLSDFVDHSYDEEDNPAYRFAMAYEALEHALNRPAGFTPKEHERLIEAAGHNKTVFERPLFDQWVLSPVSQLYQRHPGANASVAEFAGALPPPNAMRYTPY
ncbi:MAG: hypothetical protein AAGJ94_02045 [Pseudomonadota bacterium]